MPFRRLLIVLFWLAWTAVPALSQGGNNFSPSGLVHVSTIAGRKCNPASAPLFVLTVAPYTIYQCTATDTLTPLQPTTVAGGRIVIANLLAGANLGAQIQAADTALGSSKGEIWVF